MATHRTRRHVLDAALGSLLLLGEPSLMQAARAQSANTPQPPFPAVQPSRPLGFPRDFGAHPLYRIEWWYVTAWLEPQQSSGEAFGVQITFFRVRTGHPLDNPSRFSPAQLVLAHVAIADPGKGRLLHRERSARPGLGGARFSDRDTDVQIGRWSLRRTPDDRYLARIDERGLDLELSFEPIGPPVLQGDQGYSPKGPLAPQASYYYSRPWLRTAGRVNGRAVTGEAWFDHEWSSELLAEEAQGWDWAGLHLDDGRALMVFRIRDRQGESLWTQHRWISRSEARGESEGAEQARPSDPRQPQPMDDDRTHSVAPAGRVTIHFEVRRLWRSPRTGVRWPVAMTITVGTTSLWLEPLMDDQELDARGGTGVLYWEGAVRVRAADGRSIGRGYLELTGYGEKLRI
jgi:predicted secreted hydrolase